MLKLLEHLGFAVNERTRRARCLLCVAHNPTTFSWREDGRWHCFRCGAGGDKIALVQSHLRCDFRKALGVLADLAGVPLGQRQGRDPALKRRLREEQELAADATTYAAYERALWYQAVRRLHSLERGARFAAACLRLALRPDSHSTDGTAEFWWGALAGVHQELWLACAAYRLLSFGQAEDRVCFVLDPESRPALLAEVLDRGGVYDNRRQFHEVAL